MTVKEIVLLWYKTQMGYMKECEEKQHEFSDVMWKLYNELNDDGDTND